MWRRPASTDVGTQPNVATDVDRWDPLAGFDLVNRNGETVFKVGRELLRAGGQAVEAAVEEGFPAGTELEYDGGAWVVVLPYERHDEPAEPTVVVDLRPAPGYEWAEHDGRQVLRLLDTTAAAGPRPALRPPGGRDGWRWCPAGELGWVLVPPPGGPPPAAPVEAAPVAPSAPPPPAPVPPPRPTAPPTAAAPIEAAAPDPVGRQAPTRRGRLLDVLGIVLIVLGLVIAAVLLLNRSGHNGDDDAAALAEVLGVAPADLLAAVTPHEPGELPTSVAPPVDPLARIEATALVLIDVDETDAARLAEAVAGTPTPGQHLVVLLELAGDAPSPEAGYRYALLDATRPVVRPPEGDDGDGLARLDLGGAYFYDPALDAVAAEPGGGLTGAFATHLGRYVVIGVPRAELAGGTVFGHAAVRPAGTGPIGYMLSPPYQVD